ncbi:MAG: hypothetical protein K2L47_01290, partial [Clostridia bacterium]|nr:hypothetical protein [Clostridia bacterium]
ITIYDKSELKSALEELVRNSGYNTTIYNNANNVLTTRNVTQSQIDTQVTNVRNEIDRLTLKDRLKEKYNDLNNKLTGIGATSSSSGYKAIFDDLSTANSLIQASTLDVTAVNASISALDYYLDIWDTYLASGANRIIKATFGDYYATFIYPSKISLETNQTLSSCNIQFIADSNYNPTNSDYRIFFDAGGWGRKAAIIDEHFSDYSYTASHAVGGSGGAGNWNFLSYEDNTGNNGNWRFASVTYNSKPYLLVSAGHTSYKSTITLTGGTPTKAGKFTYTHDMESLAEQWTSSTNWGNRYTITYSEPVSIEYEIINAGVAEAKENLQTAKVGLINRLKNAAGRITNLDAITALISDIDNMLDNDTVIANEINALTQTVTNYNVQVDRNWDVNDV